MLGCYLDVTLKSPIVSTLVVASSKRVGYSAMEGAKYKIKKFGSARQWRAQFGRDADGQGIDFRNPAYCGNDLFYPLAFEPFGLWGPFTQFVFKHACDHAVSAAGPIEAGGRASFATRWRRIISGELAKAVGSACTVTSKDAAERYAQNKHDGQPSAY